MKPRISYDRAIGRWVADNGHETAVFPTWMLALRFVAIRWYGVSGRRWEAMRRG